MSLLSSLTENIIRNIPKIELSILKACESDKIQEKDFNGLVAKVIAMTGINKIPDDVTVSVAFNILKTHFGEFTKANFLQAFEFNIAGLYEIKHNHFYSFDADYMSNCLNGYRKMKTQAWKEFNQAKRSLPVNEVKTTNEQCFNALKKFVEDEKQVPRFWDWNSAFEHAEEAGIIKLSLKEKEELFKSVTKEIEKKKKFATDLSEHKYLNELLSANNLKTECRKRVVTEYFKNRIQMNCY